MTVQELIDSMGINPKMVYNHLVALSKEGVMSFRVASGADKNDMSKVSISFDKVGELCVLKEVSDALRDIRFKS